MIENIATAITTGVVPPVDSVAELTIENEDEDTRKERLLLLEIEKFRMKQQDRDK